jgi:hypothetical protein
MSGLFDAAIAPYVQLNLLGIEDLCQISRCQQPAAWIIHYRYVNRGQTIRVSMRYCDRHGQQFITRYQPERISP